MQYLRFMAVVVLVGFAQNASAQFPGSLEILGASGDDCFVHNLNEVPTAVFRDQSGRGHRVQICAREDESHPGRGSVVLALQEGGLSVCTVNGGSPELGSVVPTPMCGPANDMTVTIDRCKATMSAHGSIHADDPHTTYLGPATIDIEFDKKANHGNGELTITVHTPKKVIKLSGELQAAFGNHTFGSAFVDMPTCNF